MQMAVGMEARDGLVDNFLSIVRMVRSYHGELPCLDMMQA